MERRAAKSGDAELVVGGDRMDCPGGAEEAHSSAPPGRCRLHLLPRVPLTACGGSLHSWLQSLAPSERHTSRPQPTTASRSFGAKSKPPRHNRAGAASHHHGSGDECDEGVSFHGWEFRPHLAGPDMRKEMDFGLDGRSARVQDPAAGMFKPPRYRQTFHESPARRRLVRRVTPIKWFMAGLLVLFLVFATVTLARQLQTARNAVEPLPARLGTPAATPAP